MTRIARLAGLLLFAAMAVAGADKASADIRYSFPRMNGAIVDWCSTWATNCGWGGANAYCQSRGHPGARSWNIYGPGRTWVLGSSQFCNGPVCRGFSQVTCISAQGPNPGPGPGPGYGVRRFQYPQMNGAIVDWCATWATNCGWGGANQFCQARGFAQAQSWNVYRPGRTWVAGSGQYCNGPVCQGFLQVTCRR